jgi:hypothetical protein
MQRYGNGVVVQDDAFSIPLAPGSVNYVTMPVSPPTASSVTVSFTLTASEAAYLRTDSTTYGDAQAHLFLERSGDDSLQNPEYRWWCGSSAQALPANGSEVVVMTCPIEPADWTDVNGQVDAVGFEDAVQNLKWAGITFGGANGWGHGVGLGGGQAGVSGLSISFH